MSGQHSSRLLPHALRRHQTGHCRPLRRSTLPTRLVRECPPFMEHAQLNRDNNDDGAIRLSDLSYLDESLFVCFYGKRISGSCSVHACRSNGIRTMRYGLSEPNARWGCLRRCRRHLRHDRTFGWSLLVTIDRRCISFHPSLSFFSIFIWFSLPTRIYQRDTHQFHYFRPLSK